MSDPTAPQQEDLDDGLTQDAELPRRPRRRLLGAGGNPVALALLAVLVTACGFIGGVLVEKGQSSPGSSGAGAAGAFASRLASLRSGASPGASGARGASGGGSQRPTAGQVAYVDGSTLYVTTGEGATVKVKTSPATNVSKSVDANVKGIHPGETVTITGSTASGGAISAESISVGSTGGGLAALFGGSRGGASTGASGSRGGTPELFGSGG